MQPWFIWQDVDSRTMGVWVSELPAPTRASERVQEVEIPGRAGTLTLREGENVHEGYVKECVITVPWNADYPALLDWLRGDGKVVFSNEPDRCYWAHMAAEVKFDKISNSLKQATLAFYVHPHKGQVPPESDIELTASGSVYNPGNVASKPIFSLTFTTACTLTVGTNTMVLSHDSATEETVTVDCDAELVTDSNGLWGGKVVGDFPRLAVGSNTVGFTVAISTWSSSTAYAVNDLVIYSGKIYQAKKAGTNQTPASDSEYWDTLATTSGTRTGSGTLTPRWRWC